MSSYATSRHNLEKSDLQDVIVMLKKSKGKIAGKLCLLMSLRITEGSSSKVDVLVIVEEDLGGAISWV